MVYSLAYRRPPHVEGSTASADSGPSIGGTTLDETHESLQDSSINYGIPDALSFDRIIDGGTCPVSWLMCPSSHTAHVYSPTVYVIHGCPTPYIHLWSSCSPRPMFTVLIYLVLRA